jgi:hypothetical protein
MEVRSPKLVSSEDQTGARAPSASYCSTEGVAPLHTAPPVPVTAPPVLVLHHQCRYCATSAGTAPPPVPVCATSAVTAPPVPVCATSAGDCASSAGNCATSAGTAPPVPVLRHQCWYCATSAGDCATSAGVAPPVLVTAPPLYIYFSLNPILHMWFRDSCFTCDGSPTIQFSL